jgi:hypothetical protein
MSTHPDLKFNTPAWPVERDPEYNLLVEPYRVYLGSPWDYTAVDALAAHRGGASPGVRSGFLGFRLVRDSMAPGVSK